MVLVTGASGLLGQHILSVLTNQGVKVRALYCHHLPKLFTAIQQELVEWKQADILSWSEMDDVMEGITQVYHCAAVVSYDSRKFEQMQQVNVIGTAQLVDLCLHHQIQKLLFVSSVASLGKAPTDKLISEQTVWDENAQSTAYAKSKKEAEMEVWRGVAEGLHAVIVNPSVILGEGDDSRSSTNLFKIVGDEFRYYTHGATGWVDAADVARIMYQLMESDIQGERFVINAHNRPFKDVFTLMAQEMGVKPPSVYASPTITGLVWRLSYLKSLITGKTATITKETAQAAHAVNQYDNSKLLQFLTDFKYTELEATIQRIVTQMGYAKK